MEASNLAAQFVRWIMSSELPNNWLTAFKDKLVTHIAAGNGLFSFRHNSICSLVIRTSKVGMPGLPDMEEGADITVPKIPFSVLADIVQFFREVHAKHNSEAYAQVWLSADDNRYWVHVPEQEVEGASVDHKAPTSREGNTLVLEIHSHNTMSAFFSSTDDKDEARGGMRFYAVVGKLDKDLPELKVRLGSGFPNEFMDLKPEYLFDISDETITVHIPIRVLLSGQGALNWNPYQAGVCPDHWLDNVSKRRARQGTVVVSGLFAHDGREGDAGNPHGWNNADDRRLIEARAERDAAERHNGRGGKKRHRMGGRFA